MKSDEIYDGVNAIDAVRDVLNACRSEESVKDASYSYVVTKRIQQESYWVIFLMLFSKKNIKTHTRKTKQQSVYLQVL